MGYQDVLGVVWCEIEVAPTDEQDNPTRYKLLRMRTKKLAGGRAWVPAVSSTRARSVLLKQCRVSFASEGLGTRLCQVQAMSLTHAWVCPMEENILGYGCKRVALSTVQKAVADFRNGRIADDSP